MQNTAKNIIVVTGNPGVGKTTLLLKLIEKLGRKGFRVKGFVCPEVRRGGKRIGFKIRSLDGSLETWLAKIDGCFEGPRIGKYYVCRDAEKLAEIVVHEAIRHADVIAIDEIGPMELKLNGIRKSIVRALESGLPGIYVAHRKLSDAEILPILRNRGYWFVVTRDNRNNILDEIYETLLKLLKKRETPT